MLMDSKPTTVSSPIVPPPMTQIVVVFVGLEFSKRRVSRRQKVRGVQPLRPKYRRERDGVAIDAQGRTDSTHHLYRDSSLSGCPLKYCLL